jgi:predicted component of type VI protein secretion system
MTFLLSRRRLKQLKAQFDRLWTQIWQPLPRPPRFITIKALKMDEARKANLLRLDAEQHGFLHSGERA